jgi:hypothetical protein
MLLSSFDSFEDRLGLRELLEAYADAVTRCDAAAWRVLWAEDSEWILPEETGLGTIRGREAIAAVWTEAMKLFPGVLFRAWPGTMDVTGASATMRSYTAESFGRDGTLIDQRGAYDDLCVKLEGKWLFKRRSFRILRCDRIAVQAPAT